MRICLIIFLSAFIPLALIWIIAVQPVFFKQDKTKVRPVDPARLEKHVRILSETFVPRNSEYPENLDKVAAYIKQEFDKAKAKTDEQVFEVSGKTYRNVIGRFGPETGEHIIVGAHYDAWDELPGADDNASAVAGLIELAGLLGETALPFPIELVAYSLEEPPYFATPNMGSAVHAASLKEKGVKVRIMICLEMIGYFTNEKKSQTFPMPLLNLFYPSRGNFILVIGQMGKRPETRLVKTAMQSASALPVHSINAPSLVPGVDFSDHKNYWEAGYCAMMITDSAFYRNMNYHTENDTADTLDYEKMSMVVQGVYAAVKTFADKDG